MEFGVIFKIHDPADHILPPHVGIVQQRLCDLQGLIDLPGRVAEKQCAPLFVNARGTGDQQAAMAARPDMNGAAERTAVVQCRTLQRRIDFFNLNGSRARPDRQCLEQQLGAAKIGNADPRAGGHEFVKDIVAVEEGIPCLIQLIVP